MNKGPSSAQNGHDDLINLTFLSTVPPGYKPVIRAETYVVK
jgi:hypothetical protein